MLLAPSREVSLSHTYAPHFGDSHTYSQAPRDAPAPRPDPETRRVKPIQPAYQGSNVFTVLETEEDEQTQQQQRLLQHQALQMQRLETQRQQHEQQRTAAMAAAAKLPSPFLKPATFSFSSGAAPAFQFQAPAAPMPSIAANEMDPDL